MKRKVILGAGVAGLGAWYADNNAEIYEASDRAGGLCSGFDIKGFLFDKAVHFSFSKDKKVREVFDQTQQYFHHPIPDCWYDEMWIQHPIQNNLFHFPPEFKVKAIKGFINRKGRNNADNFKDWLIGGYGEFLYDKVFKRYNEKYWQMNLTDMGVEWIENRIYQPDIDEVLYGSYMDKTPNVYYAAEMRYPKQGGYYAFIRQIADQAKRAGKIHFNKRVVKVIPEDQKIYFSDGTSVYYETLYSSIPMPEMIEIIEKVPEEMAEKASMLKYTGVALVSVGLKNTDFKKFWFYIYDTDIMAARAYMPSVKSPLNVPADCSSIQFEIYYNSKDYPPQPQLAIENTIYALEKMGIARRSDVLFTDFQLVNYGNVILSKESERNVPVIENWIKSLGVIPIGRFGEWKYYWSDQAFMSGYKAVNQT